MEDLKEKISKERVLQDASKCWNDILKRDLTDPEKEYIWLLVETEVLAKTDITTMDRLHSKTEVSLTNTVKIRSNSWFNWILSSTYKHFLPKPNRSN